MFNMVAPIAPEKSPESTFSRQEEEGKEQSQTGSEFYQKVTEKRIFLRVNHLESENASSEK
jgi:hypothetical protein